VHFLGFLVFTAFCKTMSYVTYKFTNANDVFGDFKDGNSNNYKFEAGTKCKVWFESQGYRTGVFLGEYWHNNECKSTFSYVIFDDTGEKIPVPCFDIKPF
jgi:hypothetical protein